ncbi:MAG: S49 family peptidase, partial [Gammaproteobacteria bacterium]|nr:S49 family peptidase [Gammaproteobacteria bacterium]
MKDQLIASFFAASDMALCPANAQNLLSQPLPNMAVEAVTSAAMMARGERFAISRGVAVVPIRGILTPNMFMLERYMGWATYQGLEDTFGMLAANEEVAAIVPIFDTPGGMVLGLEGAASAIGAAAKIKPVHALIHPL